MQSILKEDNALLDGNDFISSDEGSDEYIDGNKPIRYNQLNSRAEYIYKILKSTSPKTQTIWKSVDTSRHLHNSDSDLNVDSTSMMAKNGSKRKRESSSEEESHHAKRKVKRSSESFSPSVIRKQQNHNLSSSDGENSSKSLSRVNQEDFSPIKLHNNTQEHLLSSDESYCEHEDTEYAKKANEDLNRFSANKETNGDISDDGDTEDETNSQTNIKAKKNNYDRSKTKQKENQVRNFTEEDEEELSKFSFLLDDKLLKKHNLWILQCPSSMDCKNIENQYLDLNGGCQLNDGKNTYEAYSYRNSQTKPTTLAVPSSQNHFQLCRIPITGNIIVEETIEDNDSKFSLPEPPQSVQVPDNLRTRHPLLGLDFKKQHRTAPRIEESPRKKKKHKTLHKEDEDNSVGNIELHKEKRKSKSKRSKEKGLDTSVTESELNSSRNTDHHRTKKKHKKHLEEANSFQEQFLEEYEEERKVKRKHKKKSYADDT